MGSESAKGYCDAATTVRIISVAVAVGLLWKLCCSSSFGGKTMKAPGRDYRINRSDFQRNPRGHFRDLRGK